MLSDRHRELIEQARAGNRARQQGRLAQKRSPVPIRTGQRDPKTGTHYATYPDQSQAANGRKLYDATVTHPIVALPLPSGATALLGPKGEPFPQAQPEQIIYRSQATPGPLKTNEVGYLNGQVWNYPQPETQTDLEWLVPLIYWSPLVGFSKPYSQAFELVGKSIIQAFPDITAPYLNNYVRASAVVSKQRLHLQEEFAIESSGNASGTTPGYGTYDVWGPRYALRFKHKRSGLVRITAKIEIDGKTIYPAGSYSEGYFAIDVFPTDWSYFSGHAGMLVYLQSVESMFRIVPTEAAKAVQFSLTPDKTQLKYGRYQAGAVEMGDNIQLTSLTEYPAAQRKFEFSETFNLGTGHYDPAYEEQQPTQDYLMINIRSRRAFTQGSLTISAKVL